ncbi:MAG TPA: carbonic anhydrase [Saprospiraceae bacterium]|nr:carbonic anhydrase [Saprospiraceae bacterium]
MKMLLGLALVLATLMSCQSRYEEALPPLEALKAGNQRFMSGHPVHPHETLKRLRDLKKGQYPHTVVVSCSDSRVPPELIFDQGLGDIFSVRTAGNVIGDYELGSIEYAVEHLGCKLVVVLGHEECGALKAYLGHRDGEISSDHIMSIVTYLENEEEEQALEMSENMSLDSAVQANIKHGVKLLQSSEPILRHLAEKGEVKIVGALYNLDNGEVTFME